MDRYNVYGRERPSSKYILTMMTLRSYEKNGTRNERMDLGHRGWDLKRAEMGMGEYCIYSKHVHLSLHLFPERLHQMINDKIEVK